MAISGKVGNVYSSALLLEDCEDAWTTGGAGRAVSTTTGKVGSYAARVTTTTIGATTLLQYEDLASTVDLTTYDGIYCWIRSSVTTAAGDLQILLDESTGCGSPDESLNVPICTATIWRQFFARLSDPSILNLVAAVGLYQVADLADGTFDVDDVEALKEIDGIKSWTLDYTADTLDATDFDDAGTKAYIAGGSGWSGSFEGYKDTTPLGIGSEVYLVLGESTTAYQNWIGKAIITACHPGASHDGIVTYSYDFQGTGALQAPDA
jgi:predicted secreted protein